jgi:hypothetical protein
LIDFPTLPIAYSSHGRRGGAGWLFAHDIDCVVVDRELICVLQKLQMLGVNSTSIPPSDMNYLYAASLLFRKSMNPHGPSARPIHVAALEHAALSCEYEPRGFWGALTGKAHRPKTAFLGVFHAAGRYNLGPHANDFTDSSACALLLNTVASQVGLEAHHFCPCGNAAQGSACPAIE